MLRWWWGDRLRYFYGRSERKNTCGESRISISFVSNFLTIVTGKLWLEKTVLWRWDSGVLSQLPSPPWDSCSVIPPVLTWLTSWRAGCTCMNEMVWKMYFTSLTIKVSGLVPPALFFISFFLLLPQFWNIHVAGLVQDLNTGDLSSLSPFPAFISVLLCFFWAKCSYNILPCTLDWGLLWRFGDFWSVLW